MRNLVANTFLSLDGVMQGPGTPEEDTTNGFTHGGWSVNYWDETMGQVMDDATNQPFDLLLGRKTYEIFAAHWPYITEGEEASMATKLNEASKYVASTTLDKVEWNNSTLISGDVPEQVAKLKEQPGPEIQIHGSSNLLQTLIKHALVDEFRIWTFPVVLGSGKRLFGDGAIPAGLKLVDHKVSTTGVLISEYQRAGGIDYGSFALEEPTEAEIERRQRLEDS